jgi:hypothetical protein
MPKLFFNILFDALVMSTGSGCDGLDLSLEMMEYACNLPREVRMDIVNEGKGRRLLADKEEVQIDGEGFIGTLHVMRARVQGKTDSSRCLHPLPVPEIFR